MGTQGPLLSMTCASHIANFDLRPEYPLANANIPASWCFALIAEIVPDISSGFASGEHNVIGSGVPHLRPMNVSREGEVDLGEVKYVAADKDTRRLQPNDVLFNNTNSRALIGKTACVTIEGDFAFSNHMTRLRPDEGIDGRFVAHQLHYLWMLGFFGRICKNHVNQSSVATGPLADTVPLFVAPTNEQRRIVAKIEELFSQLDAGVAALEEVRKKLERYRASVLKAAVEGRLTTGWREEQRVAGRDIEPATVLLERILEERKRRWLEDQLAKWEARKRKSGWDDEKIDKARPKEADKYAAKYKPPAPPDTTDLPDLPKGWVWVDVDTIAEVQGGLQKTPKRKPVEHHFPYLRVANVLRGRLDLDEIHRFELTDDELARLRLQPGDLLVVEGNGSATEIGRCAIWGGEVDDCVHQNHIIRVRTFAGTDPLFADTVINSPFGQYAMQKVASSTSGLHTLSVGKVKQMFFPLPPLEEQVAILDLMDRALSDVGKVTEIVEQGQRRASRLRQAILKKAFAGELVPQDRNDEPAEALLARIRQARETRPKTNGKKKPTTRKRKKKAKT